MLIHESRPFIGAVVGISLLAGCSPPRDLDYAASLPPLEYTVDLNDRTGDVFVVSLAVDDLGAENAVYQFASTAPGTYQTMNIGRFVRSFQAVAATGETIPSEHITQNQWRISDPEKVAEIRYTLAETWDTPVNENPVYPMAGTSIENDHVLINGNAVFGYPTGMQTRPLKIRLEYPNDWTVGTALRTDPEGFFLADDYDHVVDSPILLGRLSHAALDVRGTAVEIFTYSRTDRVQSDDIQSAVSDILDAAGQFLEELPVDRYVLLFHYEDISAGAWEHSYSSEYVFAEPADVSASMAEVRSIVSHEFFHIITPLNIHSEIVEHFNFVEPVASEHVWLYEGTTEWIAQASQLRAGLIDLETYLGRLSGKLNLDDRYDKAFSLSRLSLESHSDKGQREWGNIYQRGAIVAGLLDLLILEESGGTRGLREVVLELSDKYGPDRPFEESTFFDEFTEMTYPEVGRFFEDYVRDTQPLPVAEYYEKIGIRYEPEVRTGEQVASFEMSVSMVGEAHVVSSVGDVAARCGLQAGDEFVAFNGTAVSMATAGQVYAEFSSLGAGVDFTIAVERNGDRHEYTCAKEWTERVDRHVFSVDPDATAEQVALREAWMRNL